MNEQQLLRFIKRKLMFGYPAGELKEMLLQQGYSVEQIDGILFRLSNKTSRKNKIKDQKAISMWYLAGVALLILGIALLSAETYFQQFAYYILAAAFVLFIIGYWATATKVK